MKLTILSKMIVSEHAKEIVLSICLFAIIDVVFIYFTGMEVNKENGYIYWVGGNETIPVNLNMLLLKILNSSVIFLVVGRIIDNMSRNRMVYIFSRLSSYSGFLKQFSLVITIIGLLLLVGSHAVYYVFAGVSMTHLHVIVHYLLFDCFGFIGMSIVYLILNNVFLLENSFLPIIAIYLMNTMLPVPVIIAGSTISFIELSNEVTVRILFLMVVFLDILLLCGYSKLVKRKRVNVC